MSAARRVSRIAAGLLAGLLLVEGGLQLVRMGAQASDAARGAHDREARGGALRVLCLGACYTVGVGAPAEQSYPAHLERALEARGVDAVVLNRGVRGRTIDYFAGRIDGLLDAHSPDLVIVGINRRMAPADEAERESGWLDALLLPRMVSLAVSPAVPEADPESALDEDGWMAAEGADDSLTRQADALRVKLEAHPGRGDLWLDLADLEAGRGDFAAATEAVHQSQGGAELRPPLRMRLFRYSVAMGRFEEASQHLDAARRMPGFPQRFADKVAERRADYAADGRNAALKGGVDNARVALVKGDAAAARTHIDRVLSLDPDFSEAHHLKLYLLHLAGEPPPPPSAATLSRDARLAADPDFAASLAHYLDQIQAAASERGARLVVHTLAATPEQVPMIREVAGARGVPVVDLMGALDAEPAPDRLFHPHNHLRLSPEGNRWVAERVLAELDASGLTPLETR